MSVCTYLGGDGSDCKRCSEENSVPEFTVKFRKLGITMEKIRGQNFSMAMSEAYIKLVNIRDEIHIFEKFSDLDITTEQTK